MICLLKMELDTGASMSIMSAATFQELWPGRNLDSTDVRVQLDWKQINHVQAAGLHEVLDRHSDVFQEVLGTMKGFTAKIYVDPNATPSFNPARSVPYALWDKVEQELAWFRNFFLFLL